MRAEDLHVGNNVTWWNDSNAWLEQPVPDAPVVKFDGHRYLNQMGGEDERGGGALLYIGLDRPMPIAGAQREYPPMTRHLQKADQNPDVWVDVEKAFWWDMPVWVAAGHIDSVGIAHNHMHRGGVLDSEAWGKAREMLGFEPEHNWAP